MIEHSNNTFAPKVRKNIAIFFNNSCRYIIILRGPFGAQFIYLFFYNFNGYFFEIKYTIFSSFSYLMNLGRLLYFRKG